MPARKLSTHEHKLRGTFRKDRHEPKTVELNPSRPLPPEHLSDQAKTYFNQVADKIEQQGYLIEADVFALSLMAETMVEQQELAEFIRKNGRTYETETMTGVIHRQYPQTQLYGDCCKRLAALLQQYGLTAQSRSKVPEKKLDPKNDPTNPYFGWGEL